VGCARIEGEVDREFEHVGRAATLDDIDAVTSCLTSAFYDDPLWGYWTFPDEQSRSRDLVPFMRFWATCSLRHPWLRMTDGCEAVALWTPPGEVYVTPEEQPTMDALLDDLFGREALGFRRLGDFAPPGGPVITTMWREASE
jgi:hypothetical protein